VRVQQQNIRAFFVLNQIDDRMRKFGGFQKFASLSSLREC